MGGRRGSGASSTVVRLCSPAGAAIRRAGANATGARAGARAGAASAAQRPVSYRAAILPPPHVPRGLAPPCRAAPHAMVLACAVLANTIVRTRREARRRGRRDRSGGGASCADAQRGMELRHAPTSAAKGISCTLRRAANGSFGVRCSPQGTIIEASSAAAAAGCAGLSTARRRLCVCHVPRFFGMSYEYGYGMRSTLPPSPPAARGRRTCHQVPRWQARRGRGRRRRGIAPGDGELTCALPSPRAKPPRRSSELRGGRVWRHVSCARAHGRPRSCGGRAIEIRSCCECARPRPVK